MRFMIMDNMTLEEVGKGLLRTAQLSYPRFMTIMSHKKKEYRRLAIKGKQERLDFKTINVQMENITFHICPYSISKHDYKKYGLSFWLLASFKYQRKDMYCLISNYGTYLQIYTRHFFERYVERHLKDNSKVTINLVRKYFRETDCVCEIESVKREDYDNSVYGGTNIGTCCGYKVCENVIVFKTYIDEETLNRGDKRRVFEESQPLIKPVGMDVWGNKIFPQHLLEMILSEAAE